MPRTWLENYFRLLWGIWQASMRRAEARHRFSNIIRSIMGYFMSLNDACVRPSELRSSGDFIFCKRPCLTCCIIRECWIINRKANVTLMTLIKSLQDAKFVRRRLQRFERLEYLAMIAECHPKLIVGCWCLCQLLFSKTIFLQL